MRIVSAEFATAAVNERGWPKDRLPQVAFVGRSNVGKSSLINSLLNRKGLVRTSSTPGKTREINFFAINGRFYFVDLPGFGYARVPGRMQATWGPMIEKYLKGCPDLKLVVLLLDIRHEPGEHDRVVHSWLMENGLTAVYVATKADKVSRGNRKKHVDVIASTLGLLPGDIIQYSAETREGRDRLWDAIRRVLES
jgi:GTP-binding protein